MIIPKYIVRYVRNNLKEELKHDEHSLEVFRENIVTTEKVLNSRMGIFRKVDIIKKYNVKYQFNIDLNITIEGLILFLYDYYVRIENDVKKKKILSKSFSINGVLNVTYSFPKVILQYLENNPYYQYFIINAIKYNGTHEKEDRELYDEMEVMLHDYEKKLAGMIEDDYTINPLNIGEFLGIYDQYIRAYFNGVKDMYEKRVIDIEKIFMLVKKYMLNYLCVCKFLVKSYKEACDSKPKKEVQEKIEIKIEKDILGEYIENGKVCKLCDIETFKDLLRQANLPQELQNEYIRQMNNMFLRIEKEKLLSKKNDIFNEVLSNEEIALYNTAKVSNKIEATQIVKDIDAIIELLIDIENAHDKEEFINECKLYISYLREILELKVEDSSPKVLYYQEDGELYFLENIKSERTIQKINYKQILSTLNKIIDGNIVGDRDVQGQGLPIHLWAKGNEFKVFYTIISEIPIVIACFKKDNAFDNIKNIVTSKKFKNYLNKVKVLIESNNIPDERVWTNLIREELSKSSETRKRTKN